ncbi:colorectal mutant cancer protein, partial [Biomphalaria glabrata]
MANVPPMKLCSERAVILAHERYMRLEEGCTLRSLVDNWDGRRRLKKPALLHAVARGLVREINLPVEQAVLSPSGSFLPMEALGMPTIRKCLLDPVVTRQSDPTKLLHAARETIASYPTGVTTIYTDGSVQTLECTVKAG